MKPGTSNPRIRTMQKLPVGLLLTLALTNDADLTLV